jgi:hypothetical protein
MIKVLGTVVRACKSQLLGRQKAEIRRVVVQSQPGQKVIETPSQ